MVGTPFQYTVWHEKGKQITFSLITFSPMGGGPARDPCREGSGIQQFRTRGHSEKPLAATAHPLPWPCWIMRARTSFRRPNQKRTWPWSPAKLIAAMRPHQFEAAALFGGHDRGRHGCGREDASNAAPSASSSKPMATTSPIRPRPPSRSFVRARRMPQQPPGPPNRSRPCAPSFHVHVGTANQSQTRAPSVHAHHHARL